MARPFGPCLCGDPECRACFPAPQAEPAQATIDPQLVCAWCKTVTHAGTPGDGVSHGICEPCKDAWEARAYGVAR